VGSAPDMGSSEYGSLSFKKYPVPEKFELLPAFPNLFNPVTTIRFSIPELVQISLIVYDIRGREISILHSGIIKAGYHSIKFNGTKLSSGIYFVTLESEQFIKVQKVFLVKYVLSTFKLNESCKSSFYSSKI